MSCLQKPSARADAACEMRRAPTCWAGLFCASVLLAGITFSGDGATAESGGVAAPIIELPVTFKRIWYRTDTKRGLAGMSKSGTLTIAESGLTLDTRKGEVFVPMEDVYLVSYGTMRGDVNTEWVILGLEDEDGRRLVGLRDGGKFGYGQRTGELFESILTAVRHLGHAQYRVPEGYETFDKLHLQFTLAFPEGWTVHPRSLIEVDDRVSLGELVFSPQPVIPDKKLSHEQRDQARQEALQEIDSGSAGAIFVHRREPLKGMRCRGFSEKAVATVLEWAAADPLLESMNDADETTRTEAVQIDQCQGLRIVKRAGQGETDQRILDLRVVSDDETVFMFGLRSRQSRYEGDLERFETVVGSVRFSVALD